MKTKIAIVAGGLITICIIMVAVSGMNFRPRTGYILITKVYSDFEMKKELEKKFTATRNQREKMLDTLAIQLRLLANELDASKTRDEKKIASYNYKREEYLQKRKTFDEDNTALSAQYDKEILAQLNQYVRDFGAKNNYEYIFGNDGNGSLMYAQESNDLTRQVTEYINQKYAGK